MCGIVEWCQGMLETSLVALGFLKTSLKMQEGAINDNEFEVPEICSEKPDEPSHAAARFHKQLGGLARMRSLLPNAHYGALPILPSAQCSSASIVQSPAMQADPQACAWFGALALSAVKRLNTSIHGY